MRSCTSRARRRILRPSEGWDERWGATDAKVAKAIKDLALKPKAKKGVCNDYGQDAVANVRAAVAK